MADPDPDRPRTGEPERRTAAPLLWIVLLLALFAFGWFIYSQRSGVAPAPEPTPPRPVAIDDGRDAAAERERAADDALRTRGTGGQTRSPGPVRAGPDREATPLTRVEPAYPVQAYRRREEGTVLVAATIEPDGRPATVEVLRRSGSRELDQAAVDAVRQWTFSPAVRGGRAVQAEVQVPVTSRMER